MIIKGLKKTYNDFVLDVNDIDFDKGKIYAIIGPNGCGKSTLAKCILGIESNDDKTKATNLNVGYLAQKPYPFNMSLYKNILLNTDDTSRADDLIKKLDLNSLINQNSKSLSGGQTAKMALARILVKDYELIILDEPTASMDMKSSLLAEEAIKSYIDETKTIVLITHSISQAKRLADITIYMEDGKIIEINDTSTLLANPSSLKTKTFLEF